MSPTALPWWWRWQRHGHQRDRLSANLGSHRHDYAVVSLDADGITTGKIADEAVTNGKIADLTIQTGKIADGAITAAKLADTSVTSITAGAGLTGGTITTTGTIAHATGSFVGSEEYPVRDRG
jgi:hypothetical protein